MSGQVTMSPYIIIQVAFVLGVMAIALRMLLGGNR